MRNTFKFIAIAAVAAASLSVAACSKPADTTTPTETSTEVTSPAVDTMAPASDAAMQHLCAHFRCAQLFQ